MAEAAKTQKSGLSVNDVLGTVLASQPDLIPKLISFLLGLFKSKPKPPAPETGKPVGGDSRDDFPDDTIPAPIVTTVVTKVRLKLARIQLSKQRFPEAYTMDNPFGLMPTAEVESGKSAMPYGSKFWLDLTAYDSKDLEIMRDRVIAYGLCYKTEHHAGEAFIKGHGGTDQNPTAGYETNDTEDIGNGITAWISSDGFLHQMKAHGQGTFECSGKVDGVESNKFTIKVS